MKTTLKFVLAVSILASTVLLYRRFTTTGPTADSPAIETATADETSTPTTADATGD